MTAHHVFLSLLATLCLACEGGSGSGQIDAALAGNDDAGASLGDRALIYTQGSSISLGYGALTQALGQAGAAGVDQNGAWPASLADYRLVFLIDIAPLAADQLAMLSDFVAAGGGLVLAAEPVGNGDLPLNEVAAAVGSGASIVADQTFDGCNEVPSAAVHDLSAGADTLSVSRSMRVAGGTILYSTGGVDVLAVAGQVVVAGDANSFTDGGCLGCCSPSPSTENFWKNLWTSLPAS